MPYSFSDRVRVAFRDGARRWNGQPIDFRWFIAAICLGTVGGTIVDPAFNNYLRDTFSLAADARGRLEFPRELPGFLVALTSGLLFFLPEARTAAVSLGLNALGFAGLAFAGPDYAVVIVYMMIWSTGMHLLGPMRSAIVLSYAQEGKQATLLGTIGSITTAAAIFGSAVSWWLFSTFAMSPQTYQAAFLAGAGVTMLGALMMLRMRVPERTHQKPRSRLVVKKRYRIFYLLEVIFGARKQVFITFAPWVLITVFHQGPSTFAALAVTAATIGMFSQPWLGRLIDRFGERRILMADGMGLFLVALGYGFAHRLGEGWWVLLIVCACFVLDNQLFAVGIARTTYVDKIAEKREDVTATLSLGVTIDHVVSMSIPMLGGATWVLFGFEYVFAGAAALACVSVIAASFVRIPMEPSEVVLGRMALPEGDQPSPQQEAVPTSVS